MRALGIPALVGCGLALTACRPDIGGTWELVDATWTTLLLEEGNTVRTTEGVLELEPDGSNIGGTATLTRTTTVGDDEPEVLTESAPIDGEFQDGEAWLPAEGLFDLMCDAKGDQMVCTDTDNDDWEFARVGK